MKKRILIHINVQESGEYDIYYPTNYEKLNRLIQQKEDRQCPNFGNRLWFQGIISAIQSEDTILTYYDYAMTKDYINANFDLIIAPMANVFSVRYKHILESLAEKFTGIRIPVYVIACGVQADSYDELETLCRELKEPAGKFIRSIYQTGGEFALRGYFSKEFFDRLGFETAVVTGCPSLYQLGRGLTIEKKQLEEKDLKVILNGKLADYVRFTKTPAQLDFFDQHAYYPYLYDETFFLGQDKKELVKKLIKQEGMVTLEWLCQGKIKLIPDMSAWRNYLMQQGYNFCFGKRIHGNIMPILAGIPSVLDICDSRVREMAEFFDIPYLLPDRLENMKSLYQIYMDCDYTRFNHTFGKKYDAFEQFLREKGIVNQINTENKFFESTTPVELEIVNREQLEELKNILDRNSIYWNGYELLLKTVRRLRK